MTIKSVKISIYEQREIENICWNKNWIYFSDKKKIEFTLIYFYFDFEIDYKHTYTNIETWIYGDEFTYNFFGIHDIWANQNSNRKIREISEFKRQISRICDDSTCHKILCLNMGMILFIHYESYYESHVHLLMRR